MASRKERDTALLALFDEPTFRSVLSNPKRTEQDVLDALKAAKIDINDLKDKQKLIDHVMKSDWSTIVDIDTDFRREDGGQYLFTG